MAEGYPPGDTGSRERLETSEPRDIILDSESDIGARAGAASRFDANLDAIRALKLTEAEGRQATPQEQAVIARFSGFGDSSFEGAFRTYGSRDDDIWKRRGDQLRELTTEDEYQAIERSRLNAFYTSPEVINAMWAGIRKLGVDNVAHPRILEPSAGSGRFLGLQPADMAARSDRIAVELDDMTGRILRQLYPQSEVYVMGYEKAPIPRDSIDVAISNVPFGDFPVHDPSFTKGRRRLTRQIHNYFFAKSLEHLRPGGVLAFVTSHNTMDAPGAKPVREALAEQADLVAAIRLPKSAFPDTEVVTDIVFMRKRMPEESPGDKSWIDTGEIELQSGDRWGYTTTAPVNQYFLQHPEMVMGKQTSGGTMYRGGEYTVEDDGRPLAGSINNAMTRLPQDIIQDAPRRDVARAISLPSAINAHEGSRIIDDDGHIRIKRGGTLVDADLSMVDEGRVRDVLKVRDAARKVLEVQLRDGLADELATAQSILNTTYDEYTSKYGALNSQHNVELLQGDPDGPFLRALEDWDSDSKSADSQPSKKFKKAATLTNAEAESLKMPVFNERVIHGLKKLRSVSDESGAMAVVLNESGRLDFARMGELLGQNPDTVRESLADQRQIFRNPLGDWEPADAYLSGDVRDKLRTAEAAATANRAYKANVEALKAVQPPDLTPSQISVRLGSPWVPSSDVNEFVKQLLNAYGWRSENYYEYVGATGDWVKANKVEGNYGMMQTEYGTPAMPADQIILRLLNGKPIEVTHKDDDGKTIRDPQQTVAAQEKAESIQRAFREWIWDDPERSQRLTDIYNNTFNNYRPRRYDGSHLSLPGMLEDWTRIIHPHQKDAIWRVVQDRTSLLAHEVGFGKTAVMVGAGMELRRLGMAQKNLYVVPKATHKQFYNQFKDIYPFANVLYPTDDDFTPAKRPEFVSRVATGDWDAVILSDSQFRRIPIKPETEAAFLRGEVSALRDALYEEEQAQGGSRWGRSSKKSATHKEIQKALIRAEERLQETMTRIQEKSEYTMYFEDLGVDQMFIDEADMYKNLRFNTRMGRLKGLPNTDSQRAWDMYTKVRQLQEQGKGQGVVFATGTPVANTIAEMYTMMRYLQSPMMEAKGLQHFDAWARTFGETTETLEQTPTGAYRLTQRFAKFNNTPELSNIWQQVADIRVADEVPAVTRQRPRLVDEEGKTRRTVIPVQPDDALLDYMQSLAKRADELSGKDPHEDNMLKIANDARLASLDMRMVDAYAKPNPVGKVATAAKKIAEIHRETEKDRGAQLVFLDIGTPKASDKEIDRPGGDTEDYETTVEQQVLRNVYGVIKNHLIDAGVPANEIAFIHDAKNNTQRVALYDKVNRGDIRVLIGSTSKLGVGVNVQERAAALHHLDAPWRPRDIEQREGRVIRQGNKVYGPKRDAEGNVIDPGPGVRVYTYVTERSFDAYMWQAIEAKSKAIKAIMRREKPPRAIEDIDSFTMSAGEAKAVASGNPDILKAVTLKNNVTRLQMLRASQMDARIRAKEQLQAIPGQVKELQDDLTKMKRDGEAVQKTGDKFAVTVQGQPYTERTPAGEALRDIVEKTVQRDDPENTPDIGQYKGFGIRVVNQGPDVGYKVILRHPDTKFDYPTTAIPYGEVSPAGVLQRVENKISAIPTAIEQAERKLTSHQSNLKTYEKQAAEPFAQEDRLGKMEAELTRLEKKLQGQEVGPEIDGFDLLGEEPLDGEKTTYRFADEPEIKPTKTVVTEEPKEGKSEPKPEIVTPEVTYDKSLEDFRKASREFSLIRESYRARKIDDEAFLKGKVEYDKASEVADEAEKAYIKAKDIPKTPTLSPTPEDVPEPKPVEESTDIATTIDKMDRKRGHKFLTKELRDQFPALYSTEDVPADEKKVIAKFFSPYTNWTWYATEFDGEDTFFGLVDGFEKEWGYFSLSELATQDVHGGVPAVERDLSFGQPQIQDVRALREAAGQMVLPSEPSPTPPEIIKEIETPVQNEPEFKVEKVDKPILITETDDHQDEGVVEASEIPMEKETPLKEVTMPTGLQTLKKKERRRSDLSQSRDETQEHSIVIEPTDPRVEQWRKDPSTMDVRGVDTPPDVKPRRERRTIKTPKKPGTVKRAAIRKVVKKAPPKRARVTAPEGKKLTKAQLQAIHDERSAISQGLDNSQLHSRVISVRSPLTRKWRRDHGAMDIQGIDTPKGKTPPITDKAELKRSGTPAISGRSSVRITPRRPKLK